MNSQTFLAAVLITAVVLFFYLYFYFAHSSFLKNYIEKKFGPEENQTALFLARKLSGFLILGIIPGLLYHFLPGMSIEPFGISVGAVAKNSVLILLLIFIIIGTTFINQKINPGQSSLQMNFSAWSPRLFFVNAVGWIIYLAGYEFLFRGILLFACYNSFGFWPAIAVNTAIYSAIHMVNGKDQAIGALIFGTVACYFTLARETILIPVFMHIALSLSADYFSIKMNKNLHFIKT